MKGTDFLSLSLSGHHNSPGAFKERETERVENPKRLSPCIPAVLLAGFLGKKKMKEAWKRGALMEERKREHEGRNTSELWSSSHASPWVPPVMMAGWKCKTRSLPSAWGQERCLKKSVPKHWILCTFNLVSRPASAVCPRWAVLFSHNQYFDEAQSQSSVDNPSGEEYESAFASVVLFRCSSLRWALCREN